MDIKVGDYAMCANGIIGKVTSIVTEKGRKVYYGVTNEGKKWQSVCPKRV